MGSPCKHLCLKWWCSLNNLWWCHLNRWWWVLLLRWWCPLSLWWWVGHPLWFTGNLKWCMAECPHNSNSSSSNLHDPSSTCMIRCGCTALSAMQISSPILLALAQANNGLVAYLWRYAVLLFAASLFAFRHSTTSLITARNATYCWAKLTLTLKYDWLNICITNWCITDD